MPRIRLFLTPARLGIGLASLACAAGITYAVRSALATGIPPGNTLSYSGQLLTFGVPDNSTHMMSAALYVSGVQQCVSTTASVALSNGQFTIPLPSACATVVQNNATVDVQLIIDGVQMGQSQLGAVPYAVVAGNIAASGVTGILPVSAGGTGSGTQNFVLQDSSTGEATLPAGTTAQRATSPANGMMRYNSTSASLEAYVNGGWGSVPITVPCRAPGLMAQLNFDEGSGASAFDCTPHAHDVALNSAGTTWVAGKTGTALQFDGASGGATILDGTSIGYGSFNLAVTVEMWVKWSGNAGVGSLPALWFSDLGTIDELWLSQASASTNVLEINAAGPGCGSTAAGLVAGSWVHVAGIWNKAAGGCYLWANGVQIASNTWTASSVAMVPTQQFIGWSGGASAYAGLTYFNGAIDGLQIWDYARTPAELCVDAGRTWNGTSCS